MEHEDAQYLEYLIKGIVSKPEDVKIVRKVDELGVLMTLTVASEDMGKIIGREGNTAKAIRTILRVVGMKHDARVNIKINEPEGSEKESVERSEESSDSSDRSEATSTSTSSTPKERGMKDVDQALEDLNL